MASRCQRKPPGRRIGARVLGEPGLAMAAVTVGKAWEVNCAGSGIAPSVTSFLARGAPILLLPWRYDEPCEPPPLEESCQFSGPPDSTHAGAVFPRGLR